MQGVANAAEQAVEGRGGPIEELGHFLQLKILAVAEIEDFAVLLSEFQEAVMESALPLLEVVGGVLHLPGNRGKELIAEAEFIPMPAFAE